MTGKTEFFNTVKAAIAARLVAEGWSTLDHLPPLSVNQYAVVDKTYNTGVGERTAVLYLQPSLDNDGFVLVGNYQSEGRNALSTLWLKVTPQMSNEELMLGVVNFSCMADESIGNSYGMAIMR
jgi:hypothetical protein